MLDKRVFLLGILIGVALLGYSAYSFVATEPVKEGTIATGTVVTTNPAEVSGVAHDCGTDIYCFNSRASKCTLAKVRTYIESSTATVIAMSNEVKGGTLKDCILYQKVDSVIIQKSADLATREYAEDLKGKDMTCILSVDQINTPANFLNKCTGNLKNVFEKGLFVTS